MAKQRWVVRVRRTDSVAGSSEEDVIVEADFYRRQHDFFDFYVEDETEKPIASFQCERVLSIHK